MDIMKKLIAILILCAMLFSTAYASDIDLSGMTTEELLELNHQIQLVLFNENLVNGIVINPGEYIVGDDLPAGNYRIEVILPDSAFAFGSACVYNADDRFLETSGSITGQGYDKIGKVIMEDGQIFEVSVYSIRLFPYTGLFY